MKQIIILVTLALFTSCGFEIVSEGNVGIQTSLGKAVGEPLDAGLHFYNPLTSGVRELPIREVKFENKTSGYTKDLQIVEIAYTLNIRPDKSYMMTFYKELGENFLDKIVPQIVDARVKEVIGQSEATNLIEKRGLANDAIKSAIGDALKSKHVLLNHFELTNLDFNDAFEQAVEDKVIAKERAIQEQNKTVQIKEQAEQTVLKATAEAESIKIQSEALSKNKDLIQLEAVRRWNGVLPTHSMGGAIPFIQLNK